MIIKYLSNRESFIKLIESIGFEYKSMGIYYYKEFLIYLKSDYYNFFNGSEWYAHYYNDLKPLDKYFKNYFRSIKLKELLR